MRRGVILILAIASGCSPVPVGFDSPAKTKRMDAIVQATAEHDTRPQTIAAIIRQLDSHDPAVRFLAIKSLERLTGHTHGYDFADTQWDREPAVQNWVRWFHETYPEDHSPRTDDLADRTYE
jgi:hypothetical protein